jgi:hypothetical protein
VCPKVRLQRISPPQNPKTPKPQNPEGMKNDFCNFLGL